MSNMLQRIRERISPTDVVMYLIGGGLLFMVIWGSIATLVKGTYTTRHWIDFVISAWPRAVCMR